MTEAASLEGPSFAVSFKLVASAAVLALAAAAIGLADHPAWQAMPAGYGGVALFLAALVLFGCGQILKSKTSIDATHIRQRGLWTQEVRLADISRVKLIHVPRLQWLVAPRLVVRAGGLGTRTFHTADPAVIAAFRRLAYGDA